MYAIFDKVKNLLLEVTKFLGLVVAVSNFFSILFVPNARFFGAGLTNLKPVIDALGSEGLAVIIALIIIMAYMRKWD